MVAPSKKPRGQTVEDLKAERREASRQRVRNARAQRDRDDPVVERYKIYAQAPLQEGKKLFVVQYPNRDRDQDYSEANGCLPTEVRIKPKSGIMEMDVPINVHENYDRQKGATWGEALKSTDPTRRPGGKAGGHGLGGGFGIGSTMPVKRKNAADNDSMEMSHEDVLENFQRAIIEDRVMATQTLGGQFMAKGSPRPYYMLGHFMAGKGVNGSTESQLHLTPVDEMVQLRPQFHHIDAKMEMERLAKPREVVAQRATDHRAVHMTMKSALEGEEGQISTVGDHVRAVQDEKWLRGQYWDDVAVDSWDLFRATLVLESETAPAFESAWSEREWIDKVVPPRDPSREPYYQRLRRMDRAEREAAVEDPEFDYFENLHGHARIEVENEAEARLEREKEVKVKAEKDAEDAGIDKRLTSPKASRSKAPARTGGRRGKAAAEAKQ